MDAITSEFYITLPSNASADYFPENTQGSYRTKLSSPLNLEHSWHVGLSEIFIPRNWFNISSHNNEYSLTYNMEKTLVVDHKQYKVDISYDPKQSTEDFFFALNAKIRETCQEQLVKFIPSQDEKHIAVEIQNSSELKLYRGSGIALIQMLNLPHEHQTITESGTHPYKKLSFANELSFTILDRRPLKENTFMLPLTYIQPTAEKKI